MPRLNARVVVSDAGPLISLARLNMLGLLTDLFAEVQVPREVLNECLVVPERPSAQRIAEATVQTRLRVCDAAPFNGPAELGSGELDPIGRALAIGAGVLVDDRAARAFASRLGLDVMGTLGVLVMARRAGMVPTIAPLIDQLRAGGQRLDHTAVAQALAAAGEGLS